jgi:hypothetical protein
MEGKLGPGDVVVMGDGNYTFSRCNPYAGSNRIFYSGGMNGTPTEPIIIRSENKHGAVWDGEETNPNGGARGRYVAWMDSCSYIEFHDLEVKNNQVGFLATTSQTPCHHVTFKGNKMHNHALAAVNMQMTTHDYTFDSNVIYDSVDDLGYSADHRCSHNHNLYLNGYNITLQNNVLYNSQGGTSVTIGGFCSTNGNADPPGFTHTVHAYNNTFDGNGCVVDYTEPGGDKRYNTNDFWNRALGGGNFCNTNFGGAAPRNFKNVRMANNLFINGQTATWGGRVPHAWGNTNAESIQSPPSCDHWPWATGCSTANGDPGYLEFFNNVAVTNVQEPTHRQWADAYVDNCDGCTGINLTNEAQNDYRPTSGSTDLIGKGSPSYAPPYDFLGRMRPPGSVDVGAYQFSTPGPTPEPPSFADGG